MSDEFRPYLLTDEEARTLHVVLDHVIDETILTGLADEPLIRAAVALRDRFPRPVEAP